MVAAVDFQGQFLLLRAYLFGDDEIYIVAINFDLSVSV